ncbi:hypothetical protein [Halomonas binhaiensis]|uniref:Uncharacterized protein n=1 Tax=Halomonas binhaiensis TaxID=2562282 RepID=A0A856QPY6_9GAMM|nr:hypothetical protein [Halomonas binhaiensis]QEM81959.2 hypothetical protein E4T21_10625 [Halomonas binhaiensis]
MKDNYVQLGREVTALTHSAPGGAVAIGGEEVAEIMFDRLIREGYSAEEAKATLSDPEFQQSVLANAKRIADGGVDAGTAYTPEKQPRASFNADGQPVVVIPAVELPDEVVTGVKKPPTPAQVVLEGASEINAYLEENPELASAVEYALVAAQGPKGVLIYLANAAVAETQVGGIIAEIPAIVGRYVAEGIEGYELDGSTDKRDRYLLGGGEFAASVVIGAGGLKKGGKSHADGKGIPDTSSAGPNLTIRDHYEHHNAMRTDVINQLESQGYRVADGEASFGSSCGPGRCRPDIIYETPDGKKGIVEIKTGNADLSIRQTEIFPQIENGDAIPRGRIADRFGLQPGVPLREQGYPNGIPIEVQEFPGAGQ